MSWDDYTRAVVRINLPDGTVQVAPTQPGTCDGEFPVIPNDVVYVVTAFNPGGSVSPVSEIGRAHV